MYEDNNKETLVEEEKDLYEGYGRGYFKKQPEEMMSLGDKLYEEAWEEKEETINEEEYEYDQVGKNKRKKSSILNKTKLSKEELDELMNN